MATISRFAIATTACALLSVVSAIAQDLRTPESAFSMVPAERTATAIENGTDRVFGGHEAKDGEFPFQVALLNANNLTEAAQSQYESHFCGGALIDAEWVITAAHCMMDYGEPISADSVVVLAGSTDLEGGTRVPVREIFVHEQYSDVTMDHDVALLHLAEPVRIAPIALDYEGAASGKAVILGWGRTDTGDYPRHLMTSDIEVVGNDACDKGIKAIYTANLKFEIGVIAQRYKVPEPEVERLVSAITAGMGNPLTDAMMCAGVAEGGRDTCYGDSGGPLVAVREGRPVQVGIVSWGEGPADSDVKCGHANVYGVYSRVASFRDWIEDHLKSN